MSREPWQRREILDRVLRGLGWRGDVGSPEVGAAMSLWRLPAYMVLTALGLIPWMIFVIAITDMPVVAAGAFGSLTGLAAVIIGSVAYFRNELRELRELG